MALSPAQLSMAAWLRSRSEFCNTSAFEDAAILRIQDGMDNHWIPGQERLGHVPRHQPAHGNAMASASIEE
jgi:hypothetical protein